VCSDRRPGWIVLWKESWRQRTACRVRRMCSRPERLYLSPAWMDRFVEGVMAPTNGMSGEKNVLEAGVVVVIVGLDGSLYGKNQCADERHVG